MKLITVSTQAQYDEAQKQYWKTLDKNYFDIDRDKGREAVEEVDRLIRNFLYEGASKKDTENDLARLYFSRTQAEEITGYFLTRPPGDVYYTEQGLNMLNFRAGGEMNTRSPVIQIKNSTEKICVRYPVEVFGESEIEASGHARVTARDGSRITARGRALVRAFDNARVAAHDQSHVIAKNSSSVTLYGNSTASAHNYARITATEDSKAAVSGQTTATVLNTARADAYDRALIFAKNGSIINAFNDAVVNADDDSRITAGNTSYVSASGSASIDAGDYAVVAAGDKVKVTAHNRSLVFLKNNLVCEADDEAEVIDTTRNIPDLLENNVLRLLDHPFIGWNPVIAVNLLLASANPSDREAFARKLKDLGCIDPASTNRVLQSMAKKANPAAHRAGDRDRSWER